MPQHDTIPPAENAVWMEFLKGDRVAFAQLYHQHIRMLIGYGMRIAGEQDIVKDAIQDLFVELWRSRERLQPVNAVHSYLLRALRYKLMRYARIQARYSAEIPEGIDPDNIEHTITGHEHASQQQAKLKDAIARLPVRQQEAINLRFYHDCSNEDIAGIMGMNYQSASNLLHRAILQLRKHLSFLFF